MIAFNLLWIGFVCVYVCVKPPTKDFARAMGEVIQAPPVRYTWEEAGGHQYVGGGGVVGVRGSDYVKLLMNLEGIVIKVSTFSPEQRYVPHTVMS